MTQLDLDMLTAACRPGGAAALTSVTDLTPAEGEHGGVAPARFVDQRNATYAYETRFVDDETAKVVLIDSKASQLNRVEVEIEKAIDDGIDPLSLTPRIAVTYGGGHREFDYTLPHRLYDGHIRAGSVEGAPVTQHPDYLAARNATTADVRPILELAPTALVFGGWDSTRKSRQGRYRSGLVGEVIGVLADQGPDGTTPPRRGGARVDPIAASVRLTGPQLKQLLDDQRDELSTKNVEKIEKDIKSSRSGRTSAAPLGLGAIPPSLAGLGLVACRRIIRSHVITFSALRQLRFGAGPDGDAACRALLVAYALAGLARADAELDLRANCNLREAGPTSVTIDARHGKTIDLEPLAIADADALLNASIENARSLAGIRWEGQVFEVTGNDLIINNADADTDDED
ncbi:type I-U CRISPR-associated protein Cas7 [Gordonia desulfuricans]|uniref:Type I-U CRISPR-associated protein Cas7 n=1 Tax=Gordonia desulfuricans TaxID=89051 RepID=A0A7K3LN92_9ACTN|nr:type I-U CRISPR-associated RAMP protein Csb1/Cas7u [Gordonia desulfuricans]NDK89653.1 type I-U CRISPR-associated protein Cas7 [Gordonia desulfuricans]